MNFKIPENIKTILITGGAGFIGGWLVRRLLQETKITIINIDKYSYASDLEGINNLLMKNAINKERYFFFQTDLNNSEKISEILFAKRPDYIMHLAAESHVDRSIDNPYEFISSNIIGTYKLLEATRKYYSTLSSEKKNIFRYLHISTDEVFGSLGDVGLFNEKTSYDPRSPYSASKASSDHLVSAWHHTYNMPTIITNCSNNYGPWQFPEKLIPLVILKALNGEKIPIYGDGENIRDWLFVSDHIDGLVKAITLGKVGERYCIGGMSEIKNINVVKTVCEVLDKIKPRKYKHKDLITFVPDRPGHDKRYGIDATKIIKELDWKPKYNFEEGIALTVKWYISNIDWTKKVLARTNYTGSRLGLN